MDLRTSQLDLAARGIDLTSQLTNALSSGDTLLRGLLEVGQWLGREMLNKHELMECWTLAKGLVVPNEQAYNFFQKLLEAGTSNPVKHIFLVQRGSLGRMMMGDPPLCWVVSTVVCLYQCHSDEAFISDAICTFIMKMRPPHNAVNDAVFDLRYHPARLVLNTVVRKIVSSIWLNVVTAKADKVPLPMELLSVCPVGHNLDSVNFGAILHALQTPRTRVVVRSKHLLRNLTLWLLFHFDGQIMVAVSGKKVYEKVLGSGQRKIELRVDNFCPTSEFDIPGKDKGTADTRCSGDNTQVELFEVVGDTFKSFLSGTYPSPKDLPNQPGVRQPIYSVTSAYPKDHRIKGRSVQISIKCTAQEMVKWLINLPVLPPADFSNLGFSVLLDGLDTNNSCTLGSVLKRGPSMLNMAWGDSPPSRKVYVSVDEAAEEENSMDGVEDGDVAMQDEIDRERFLEELLPYFPILEDLLKEVRTVCRCRSCSTEKEMGTSLLQDGCLCRASLREVFLFIGHAIADGFGCDDVAVVKDADQIIEAVSVVLFELVGDQKIIWDTWFGLSASVYLGCPWKHHVGDLEYSGTTFAAVQYGNLAVLAPWLDLSMPLKIEKLFSLISAQGQISLNQSNGAQSWFRSVEDNYAIVQCEHTQDTSSFVERYPHKHIAPMDPITISQDDTTTVKTDMILVSASENVYRLLLRVETPSHQRIVDPSDAVIRLARGLKVYECKHASSNTIIDGTLPSRVKVYSSDDVLGRWANIEGFYGLNKMEGPPLLTRHDDIIHGGSGGAAVGTMHMTQFLDSPLKQNIAMALSVNDVVIANDGSSCLSCLFEQAQKAPTHSDIEDDVKDRYVINVVIKSDALVLTKSKKRRIIKG